MIDLNVVCVYRPGGAYTAEYVRRLRSAVARNLRTNHRFICLTDRRDPSHIPGHLDLLHPEWPGWWSKIEAFRIVGPTIYLDLDTVIVGDLGALALWAINPSNDGRLGMIRDFYTGIPQTGVLAWNGDMMSLFREFRAEADGLGGWTSGQGRVCPAFNAEGKRYHGDADWTREHAWNIAFLTGEVGGIVSYKVHVAGRSIPEGASIVCFHGTPRPHEVLPMPDWMVENWLGVKAKPAEVRK